MGFLSDLHKQAVRNPKIIVLAEGEDERIIAAARAASKDGIAKPILLGDRRRIRDSGDLDGIEIVDPSTDCRLDRFKAVYSDIRGSKLKSSEEADSMIRNPLGFAAMMVREGCADATIAGAVATTADTILAALRIIGRAPGSSLVSSFFLMLPEDRSGPFRDRVLFADCALVVEPTAEELADIAVNSVESARSFLDEEPRVAMLSFSTRGSAAHDRVLRVRRATEMVRSRCPGLEIDGEIQFDAAVDAVIRERKAPLSELSDAPNVFVFPNLDAANIGYKIAERVGGMTAVGPVLQGLSKPANDLSRGCSVADIHNLIAISVVQAGNTERGKEESP